MLPFLFFITPCLAWSSSAIDTLYLTNSSLQLPFVVNGTGTNGGIYQAQRGLSQTSAAYGTYDYCCMPHPRATEYELPPAIISGNITGQLVFLEYTQRHHKRTPYNILPSGENQEYDCSDVDQFQYASIMEGSVAQVFAETYSSSTNPFLVNYVNGSCQFPQITSGGIMDAIQHGKDLWGVYGDLLKFLPLEPDSTTFIRTSNSELTQNTAGGVIGGMYPNYTQPVPIHQQTMDTINGGFPCSAISSLQTWYMQNSIWMNHLTAAAPLLADLDEILNTKNFPPWHQSFDHFVDNFQARQCNGYDLPCNIHNTSDCVSQPQANEVYRLGDWEWNYYWVAQPNKTQYITTVEGLFIAEILAHFTSATTTTDFPLKLSHTFAHDGDIGPVLGALGISSLRWPGMGSNIAMELWKTNDTSSEYYVRVLYCGAPFRTATGDLGWIPYTKFQSMLAVYIPEDIVTLCTL